MNKPHPQTTREATVDGNDNDNTDKDNDDNVTRTRTAATRPAIYSVPTTDTLGEDESWRGGGGVLVRPYSSPSRSWQSKSSTGGVSTAYPATATAPALSRTPSQGTGSATMTPMRYHRTTTAAASATTPSASHRITTPSQRARATKQQKQQSTSKHPTITAAATAAAAATATATTTTTPISTGSGVPPPSVAVKIPLSRRKPRVRNNSSNGTTTTTTTTRQFRLAVDAPAVTVQFVPTAQRAAYTVLPAPAWKVYQQRLSFVASQHNNNHNNNTSSSSNSNSNHDKRHPYHHHPHPPTTTLLHKRLSPSPQHLELLHTLQAQDWIRQVDFAPSCSVDADAQDVFAATTTTTGTINQQHPDRRDGRYAALDIQAAYTASLPAVPPQLSHRKTRLPSRADVGWPGASPAEIAQKQKEIQHETAWEEATPRLVVLCTSQDLGQLVLHDNHVHDNHDHHQHDNHRDTDGLPGMPAAGRPLQRAMMENQRAWNKPHNDDDNKDKNNLPPSSSSSSSSLLAPNPTSLLAPPLQATYSASLHWRPRLFHDRAPLRNYVAACPLDLITPDGIDKQEPRLLSLALYQLPYHMTTTTTTTSNESSLSSSAQLRGKISEDVWFPIGQGWTQHLQLAAMRQEAQDFGPAAANALAKAWWQRRNKAVFSVDATMQKQPQVVLVARLYRLPSATAVEQFGFDLLVPLALGVLPWNKALGGQTSSSGSQRTWPIGNTGRLTLYSWTTGESTEDFLERIALIVQGTTQDRHVVDDGNSNTTPPPSSAASVESDAVRETPSVAATPSKRPSSRMRHIFRSPRYTRNTSKTSAAPTNMAREPDMFDAAPVALQNQQSLQLLEGWYLNVFVSSLGADFLNALLTTPTELACPAEISTRLPRLVVDPTGDAAVSVPPPVQRAPDLPTATLDANTDGNARKRSDLVRLPPLTTPAGYTDAAEFREVLPLAPRLERQYPVDAPFGTSYRSLLNLLYIYPRVLRLSSDSKQQQHALSRVTVRVRLIQNEIILEEDTGKILSRNLALARFHSAVPWASDTLVDRVFTTIQGQAEADRTGSLLDLNVGVTFGDEIKIRLPEILDGSYSLEFTIYHVEDADGGLSLTRLGDTTVPLSSSSREPSTGSKVTTVIPNGNHRVKLGELQLQVETRLVSSIHVSDPTVALALRDFPYAKFQHDKQGGQYISSSQSVDTVDDFKESFSTTSLSMSNPSAVVAHMRPLLHMHLCNLVNLNERGRNDAATAVQFFSDNMKSLFEILRSIKASFVMDGKKTLDETSLLLVLKQFVDGFDEGYLSSASSPDGQLADHVENTLSDENYPAIERTASGDSTVSVASLSEGSVRMQARRRLYKKYEDRVNKIVAAIGSSGTPFSRVAFGATNADRMRAEAEIDADDGGHHMFDDDETIMTDWTSPRGANADGFSSEARHARGIDGGPSLTQELRKEVSANSILHSASSGLRESAETEQKASSGNEFARRVRSAAQTMLAPCVGPSLSNILASARGTSLPSQTLSDAGQPDEVAIASSKSKESSKKNFEFLPGSEDEDDTDARNIRPNFCDKEGEKVFRGAAEGPMFILSSKALDEKEVIFVGGHFLYESIIVLWLQKWFEYCSRMSNERGGSPTKRRPVCFPVPAFDPSIRTGMTVASFFQHMDIILPICLKSLTLRYTAEVLPVYPAATRVQLDSGHQLVFEQFAGMAARGLIGMSLEGLGSRENTEGALTYSLASSNIVVEFFVGLTCIFHEEHARAIVTKYLKTLKDAETEHLVGNVTEVDFEWNEETLLRVRCSRQLRLRAIEVLSSMPSFCNLNFPCKFHDANQRSKPSTPTWLKQYCINENVVGDGLGMAPKYLDGLKRVPVAGWLSNLVIEEALSICSLSSEAVIAEALAHAEVARQESGKQSNVVTPSLKKRPGATLQRDDLLMFQSLSIHGITIVYELVLRRNALDRRFQSDATRQRIAALFAQPILEKSVSSVRWLARMESTHKVRALWLLCFVYILQEAPDSLVQGYIKACCDAKNIRVHRFIRLLRICSSTFQGFVDRSKGQADIDSGLPAWLLQESFNTICATTNTVVEACLDFTSAYPQEKRKVMQGLIDLLLHILTTPQSTVTHLRALGGALQAMEQFGVDLFLDITGDNFQHWCRVLLSLMNSPSLSVRSISVDFAVSLLGGAFDLTGTIENISLVLLTVLPEVVAREIALYNVSGQIASYEDVSSCVWPLRRALTDVQDANPLDDDRVDPQLPPQLTIFGRGCQAIIDGVLVEMQFRRNRFLKFRDQNESLDIFDADEESLFEAAAFFSPETSPLQRIRWLRSLKILHERNERCIEAAETAMLCAETVAQSIQNLKCIWRPTNFALWTDSTRSHWLENVGEEIGEPDFGNREVMDFANSFLEPDDFLAAEAKKSSSSGKLHQPTLGGMCEMLNSFAKDSTDLYLKASGCEELALQRLEVIQKTLTANFLEATKSAGRAFRGRRRQVEDEAILRRMISNISVASAKLSERVLARAIDPNTKSLLAEPSRVYVAVKISGKKLKRFTETVALPPFLEWDEYCICGVPTDSTANEDHNGLDDRRLYYSKQFAHLLVKAIGRHTAAGDTLQLVDVPHQGSKDDNMTTILEVFPVEPSASISSLRGLTLTSRRFSCRKMDEDNRLAIDFTVAQSFPCALSRQRSIVTADTCFPN